MKSSIATIVLATGLVFAVLTLAARLSDVRLPGNQQGYEPVQPIAYSHRLHAGELQVDCLYCHSGAEQSRHAGVPPAGVCMNCHGFVTTSLGALRAEDELAKQEGREPRKLISPELAKLYNAMGLDERKPDPSQAQPIAWTKVHNLPDFVYFDHRAHQQAGVRCQTCHGPVETMERVRQFESLSMGWCVNCHRQANEIGVAGKPVNASIDCATCHY
ncbi:MAG: cytochrome c3 family protein [Bryobacteraceae bacterium]|nr:cytochrome c3 family protein [Bryobacteraceae bacterium]